MVKVYKHSRLNYTLTIKADGSIELEYLSVLVKGIKSNHQFSNLVEAMDAFTLDFEDFKEVV